MTITSDGTLGNHLFSTTWWCHWECYVMSLCYLPGWHAACLQHYTPNRQSHQNITTEGPSYNKMCHYIYYVCISLYWWLLSSIYSLLYTISFRVVKPTNVMLLATFFKSLFKKHNRSRLMQIGQYHRSILHPITFRQIPTVYRWTEQRYKSYFC